MYHCKLNIRFGEETRFAESRRERRPIFYDISNRPCVTSKRTTYDCSGIAKKLTEVNLSGPAGARVGETTNHVYKFAEAVARHSVAWHGVAWRAMKPRHRVFGNIERVQSYDSAVKLARSKFARSFSTVPLLGLSRPEGPIQTGIQRI